MAKGNMLLGHARGKVGSLVFSRTDGQQIVRSKAEVVKNPQTTKQMIQRIILQTICQAYSRMMIICDHSFEGVKEGAESQRYFMQKNIDALRLKVSQALSKGWDFSDIYAFSPLKTNVLAINTYVVSKGTLPEVAVVNVNDDSKQAFNLPANTYASVIATYGLKRGDQLTFVGIAGKDETKLSFSYARVILDPRDAEGNELSLDTQFVADGKIASPSPRNEGEFATLAYNAGKVEFSFNTLFMAAGAIIVSRQRTDGEWQRSNASLLANDANIYGYTLQAALDMLGGSDINTLNDLYLNNAGQGNVAGVNAGGGNAGGGDEDDVPGAGGGQG